MTQNNLYGLWPHQEKAVVDIETAWRNGYRSVCYQLGTGGGKSRILRQIINNHYAAKKTIYLIAHRKNLVDQLSDEIREAGINHGIIAAGKPYIRYRVQVASLQTLVRRKGLPESDLIVIDEFHHARSKSYLSIIERWPDALVLGVTATPERLDGKPLSEVADHLITGPDMRTLIDQGFLSDYEYYAPQIINPPKHMTGGEYRLDEVASLMDNKKIIGSAVDHYKKYADGLPAIVSCASIAHAEHVAEGFSNSGYRAMAVHSKIDQKLIKGALNGLKNGSMQVITQCELLGEGIDIPGATVLIGLRHTASLTIFLQHIGRVLRKCEGKDKAIILDHVGNYLRHGMPDDPRQWSLDKIRMKDSGTLEYKRCPKCIRPVVRSARTCPSCGFQWAAERVSRQLPEEVEGELVAISRPKTTITWEGLIEEIRIGAGSMKESIAIARSFGYRHTAGYTVWKKVLRR
jgi:DNA repair protein RadD